MTYRDISFNYDMMLAILRGDKNQTRRIIKPQPPAECLCFSYRDSLLWGENEEDTLRIISCPYAMKLRILEPYRIATCVEDEHIVMGFYLADDAKFTRRLEGPQWERFTARKRPFAPTPGRFMYRSLSRITIEREYAVGQRLSAITDEGALAEGVSRELSLSPRKLFLKLWDVINGKTCPAKTDPLVWAMTFKWEFNQGCG